MPNKPKLREKSCEHCGNTFLAAKSRTKYCSNDCKYAARVNDPNQLFKYGKEISGTRLRKAMIAVGVEYVCFACGMLPVWQGNPLTIEVDHINGSRVDCRLINLRFLCPNCHSQTPTFRAGNRGNCVVVVENAMELELSTGQ